MGMYTELIVGASLKEDVPQRVVETLLYMTGQSKCKPDDFPFDGERYAWMLRAGSCYFGVNDGFARFWRDKLLDTWHLSSRSSLKNYGDEIETFLAWLKPHIEYGSGTRNFYAIVTYEEASKPEIYYLD